MISGNLNFLEPSGLLQACNESALPSFYLEEKRREEEERRGEAKRTEETEEKIREERREGKGREEKRREEKRRDEKRREEKGREEKRRKRCIEITFHSTNKISDDVMSIYFIGLKMNGIYY
jgi:hypothetical protein